MWKRWSKEYLRGLRERHNLTHKVKQSKLSVGDVVTIKSEGEESGEMALGYCYGTVSRSRRGGEGS